MGRLKDTIAKAFGIAEQAKVAKTAADYGKLVTTIQTERDAANDELRQLEGQRSTLLLDGGDADAFHKALSDAKDKVRTLGDNLSTAGLRREEAARREAAEELEARLLAEHAAVVPPYQDAHRRAHALMVGLAEVKAEIDGYDQRISAANYEAVQGQRPDLGIDAAAARAQVAETLMAEAQPAPDAPAELPPPAPFVRGNRIPRQQGESEANWKVRDDAHWADMKAEYERPIRLRQQNHAARLEAIQRRDDPFKVAWEKAQPAGEAIAFPMGAHEASRNRRLIDVRGHRTPDGGGVMRPQAVDGRRGAGVVQAEGAVVRTG